MCRMLGDLLQDGVVAKIADDLYCGGDTPVQLLANWRRVLQALDKCDLKLSSNKTVITPKSTTIFKDGFGLKTPYTQVPTVLLLYQLAHHQ